MDKKLVIGPATAKEIMRILQSYRCRYGNITIEELINKFDTDTLILN